VRHPAVRTEEVLAHTLRTVREAESDALVVANVQETDLAGHQQDAARFGAVLEEADAGLAALLRELNRPGDRLLVTADHGNDPTIGHAFHTREYVPVLVHRPGEGTDGPRLLPDAASLADVGATAARWLGLSPEPAGPDGPDGPDGPCDTGGADEADEADDTGRTDGADGAGSLPAGSPLPV
jgi:phosphopentomutase